MTGIEVAVGFLIAWAAKKANRVGKRAEEIADEAVDLSLDRLHDVVAAKLGGDPSLARLETEAAEGRSVAERTRQRVQLALEDAAADDPDFADRLEQAVQQAHSADDGSTVNNAATRGVSIGGDVSGIVATGDNSTITQHR